MAEIIQIERDGVIQYPITKPECVIDENGKNLKTQLTELSTEVGKCNVGAVDTNESVEEPEIGGGGGGSTTDLTAVAKWGVVTQTLTRVGNNNDGYVVQVSNPQYGWIPQSFIDEVTAVGGYYETRADMNSFKVKEMPIFNAKTGYFEYRGLTNLAYDEMQAACAFSRTLFTSLAEGATSYSSTINQRCNKLRCVLHNALYVEMGYFRFSSCFRSASFLEYSIFNNKLSEIFIKGDGLRYCYTGAISIKDIGYYNATTMSRTYQGEFGFCYSLETAWFSNVNADITFKDSPRLKYECIAYLIQNAKANSSFSITLHATALANAEAAYLEDASQDHATYPTLSDWALSKKIQLATA